MTHHSPVYSKLYSKRRKPLEFQRFSVVNHTGLEPVTSWLSPTRSPSWANDSLKFQRFWGVDYYISRSTKNGTLALYHDILNTINKKREIPLNSLYYFQTYSILFLIYKQVIKRILYSFWSSSLGMYATTSSILQLRMRQRSFRVLVETSLSCFKRNKVLDEIWCLSVSVYQFSSDSFIVFQNGA